jgi:hypothetical protein
MLVEITRGLIATRLGRVTRSERNPTRSRVVRRCCYVDAYGGPAWLEAY